MKKTHTPYWFNVIKKAITRENEGEVPFTEGHIQKARDWPTCACGKQDPRIPRYAFKFRHGLSGPEDVDLTAYGFEFSNHVGNQRPAEALTSLLAIEKRSAEILKGLA